MPKNQPILVDIGQGLSLMMGLPTLTSWETKTRPKNVKRGTFGFNLSTQSLEYWDGEGWLAANMISE